MVVPPISTPNWSSLVGKPDVCWAPPFWKLPYPINSVMWVQCAGFQWNLRCCGYFESHSAVGNELHFNDMYPCPEGCIVAWWMGYGSRLVTCILGEWFKRCLLNMTSLVCVVPFSCHCYVGGEHLVGETGSNASHMILAPIPFYSRPSIWVEISTWVGFMILDQCLVC